MCGLDLPRDGAAVSFGQVTRTAAVTLVAVTGLIWLQSLLTARAPASLDGYCDPEPPWTILSFSFWSTVSTVRSISAFGTPS